MRTQGSPVPLRRVSLRGTVDQLEVGLAGGSRGVALLATRSVLLPSKPGFAPGPTTAGNRTCARAAGKAEGRSLAARVGAPPDHYGATVQARARQASVGLGRCRAPSPWLRRPWARSALG